MHILDIFDENTKIWKKKNKKNKSNSRKILFAIILGVFLTYAKKESVQKLGAWKQTHIVNTEHF